MRPRILETTCDFDQALVLSELVVLTVESSIQHCSSTTAEHLTTAPNFL